MTLFVTYTGEETKSLSKSRHIGFSTPFGIFNSKTYPPQIHVYVEFNFWCENANYVDCQVNTWRRGVKVAKSKKENSQILFQT